MASVLTTYSARRALPSVAEALGLSTGDRVALGGWAGSSPHRQWNAGAEAAQNVDAVL